MIFPQDFSSKSKKVSIPIGDPAGVGTEIILKALASDSLPDSMEAILIGCKKYIENTFQSLKKSGELHLVDPSNFEILDIPLQEEIVLGKPSAKSGKASFEWLTKATNLVIERKARAIVTAPIAKFAWHEAGHFYSGQTERLGELTNTKNPSMLFTAISPNNGWRMNTLLATTHIPLEQIPKTLSKELILNKLDDLKKFCKKFKDKPHIAVAGINPHAGENGNLGKEEKNWLLQTLKTWRSKNPDVFLQGPIAPDTCWLSAARAWEGGKKSDAPDGYLAMYHDQGLIAVKLIAFDSAVNTTLGLPIVRTSPDHGTAFDIAGKWIANHESMLAALKTAWILSK